jgi:hypothetical protein
VYDNLENTIHYEVIGVNRSWSKTKENDRLFLSVIRRFGQGFTSKFALLFSQSSMNLRSFRKALAPRQCRELEHAWIEAARQDRPLNRMVTIRPLGDLTPLDHAHLVDRTWNKLGGWSRYHGSGFFCLLVREKQTGSREHFHVLIHVPNGKTAAFAEAVARWFPPHQADIDIRPAHQRVSWTPANKVRSAIGYLTKQRSPQAAWRTPYSRQAGGPVLGKRYRITRNLLSPEVVHVRPKPYEKGRAA